MTDLGIEGIGDLSKLQSEDVNAVLDEVDQQHTVLPALAAQDSSRLPW